MVTRRSTQKIHCCGLLKMQMLKLCCMWIKRGSRIMSDNQKGNRSSVRRLHKMMGVQEVNSKGMKHHDAVLVINGRVRAFLKAMPKGENLAVAGWRNVVEYAKRSIRPLKAISRVAAGQYIVDLDGAFKAMAESRWGEKGKGEGNDTE